VKQISQLRSEYKEEVEKLNEKYRILLQNVDTEAALKKMEFETQCKLVSSSEELAEVWIHNMLHDCEMVVGQCSEQGIEIMVCIFIESVNYPFSV